MMNNKLLVIGVAAIVVGAGSFYVGMRYGANQADSARQAQFGSRMGGPRGMRGGGAISGTVIAEDSTSMTIKLRNEGSSIVFLGSSTTVGKTVEGTRDDIQVGNNVTVIGTPNSDGSFTAQSVQIRPAMSSTTVPTRVLY